MIFRIIRKWISQRKIRKNIQNAQAESETENGILKNAFSPMSYRNPYIQYLHEIIEHVISQKKIAYQMLEMVIIDAEEGRDQDDEDIQIFLYEIGQRLNYLLLVTDRPDRYEAFMDEMYEENGLIVQHVSKSVHKQARGNLVLDFERSSGIFGENRICAHAIYLPIYKRPWEISENLDILVPVGYNTLVVGGIFPPDLEESCSRNERFRKDKMTDQLIRELFRKDKMTDRLDREFRKG